MDSEKANVGTFYLTIPILILTAIGVGLMAWSQLSPPTATQAPPSTGPGATWMSGWIPIIIVATGLVLSIILQLFLGLRLRKNKILRADLARARSDLGKEQRDRQTCTENYQELEHERDTINGQISDLRRDFALAEEGHKAELTGTNIKLRMTEDELKSTKRDLTEANKVIRDEKNQKEIHYQLWRDEKAKYEELLWFTEIIERQEKAISKYVVISNLSKVRVYLADSPDGGPRIRFSFRIQSDSIFPEITIHRDRVKGHVSFRGKDLTESVKLDWHVQGVPMVDKLAREQWGWLNLEQDFTKAETDRIENALKSANAAFGFEDITIQISGGTRFPKVDEHTLEIPGQFKSVLLKDCDINGNTNNA